MVDSLLGKNGDGGKPRAKSGRLARTIVLGSVAVAFAIYWLARSYGVDMEELITYLKASLAFVAFFALVGILAGAVIWFVRWWRMRS